MRDLLVTAAAVAAAIVVGAAVVHSSLSTGPGCPGDPSWLGHCSEVNAQ